MKLPFFSGVIVAAIVTVDFVWAYRNAAKQERTSWRFWTGEGLVAAIDACVGVVVGLVTWVGIVVLMRVEFSERGAFVAPVWIRLPRMAVNLVACGVGVLGGVTLRGFLIRVAGLTNMERRRYIAVGACFLAAVLLHLSFVRHGQGFYEMEQLPPHAWFGFFGEYGPFGDDYRLTAHKLWFGPRLSTMKYGDLVCFVGGMVAPAVLLSATAFFLIRGLKDAYVEEQILLNGKTGQTLPLRANDESI
jgi:hypothetical protein